MTENFPKLYVKSYVEDQALLFMEEAEIEPTLEALMAYYKERVVDIYGDDEDDEDDYDYNGPLLFILSFDRYFDMTATSNGHEYLAETLQHIKDLYTIGQLLDELSIRKKYVGNSWFHVLIHGKTVQLSFWDRTRIVISNILGRHTTFMNSNFDNLKKNLLTLLGNGSL